MCLSCFYLKKVKELKKSQNLSEFIKSQVIYEHKCLNYALDSKKKLLCETYKVVMFSIAFDIFWLFLALTVIPLLKFLMF